MVPRTLVLIHSHKFVPHSLCCTFSTAVAHLFYGKSTARAWICGFSFQRTWFSFYHQWRSTISLALKMGFFPAGFGLWCFVSLKIFQTGTCHLQNGDTIYVYDCVWINAKSSKISRSGCYSDPNMTILATSERDSFPWSQNWVLLNPRWLGIPCGTFFGSHQVHQLSLASFFARLMSSLLSILPRNWSWYSLSFDSRHFFFVKSPCSLFYIFWPGKSYRKKQFLNNESNYE